jgi:putative transposase
VVRQCHLLDVNRASYYYAPLGESGFNLMLMRLLDEQYTRTPFYGSPRMTAWLQQQGYAVNHKRIECQESPRCVPAILVVYPCFCKIGRSA